uniref:Uncharacterized protein n=1 Tax=Stegastes partitus TaxID=144197 RepID=A0A3B5AAJ2_9TELE
VSSFPEACRVMEQRVHQDVQTLKAHWENYGYQAPSSQSEFILRLSPAEREEGSQEEDGAALCSPPPSAPAFSGMLRTPQLPDFGLCAVQMKRALAGAQWCSEVPPMPEMILPHPALTTPAPPLLPLTPKCALWMDDDELQTPQMHDFGVSERSVCLNNIFTINQKNVEKPQRWSITIRTTRLLSALNCFSSPEKFLNLHDFVAGTLESPELPVLCSPGLKLKQASAPCSSPAPGSGEPGSPGGPNLPGTPEVPAFQTPYVANWSAPESCEGVCGTFRGCVCFQTNLQLRVCVSFQSLQQPDPTGTEELPTSPPEGAPGSKRCWEHDGPDVSVMPEMPNLESVLGKSLQRVRKEFLWHQLQEAAKRTEDVWCLSLQKRHKTDFSLIKYTLILK